MLPIRMLDSRRVILFLRCGTVAAANCFSSRTTFTSKDSSATVLRINQNRPIHKCLKSFRAALRYWLSVFSMVAESTEILQLG